MHSLGLILSNRKYFAPAWVFASINILTGTWVLYLPHIKAKFGLDDGQLGIAIFCTALGLLISLPFAPYLNKKLGVGRATQIGVLCHALSYSLPLFMPTYYSLCLSLLVVGLLSGFTDISMNALVTTIEKDDKQHFMSSAHGFFSLGGFIGAGLGSILMSYVTTPAIHMVIMSLFILGTNIYLMNAYSHIKEENIETAKTGSKLKNLIPLLGIATIAFIVMFNEGAVEHWSNLYLHDIVSFSEQKAGLGFIAFSLCMTLGRFFGDGISKRYGAISSLKGGVAIAILGYLFVLFAHPYLVVFGFGVIGLGLSVVVPEVFRLAGNTKGVPATEGISLVSGVGFAGFMIGPVLLGYISDVFTLVSSFTFLLLTLVLGLVLSFFSLQRAGSESKS